MKKISRRRFVGTLVGTLSAAAAMLYGFAGSRLRQGIESGVSVLTPEDPMYDLFQFTGNRRNENLKPGMIAQCNSVEQIQNAIRYAKSKQVEYFNLRSRGKHSLLRKASEKEMAIDTSSLKNIRWISSDVVEIEPGVSTFDIVNELSGRGRALASADCATINFMSLCLGGGISKFSREHGLLCDSLIAVEMVNSSGNIVSSEEDPQILWAARGGRGYFPGIPTKMRFKTFALPQNLVKESFEIESRSAFEVRSKLRSWLEQGVQLSKKAYSKVTVKANYDLVVEYQSTDTSRSNKTDQSFVGNWQQNAARKESDQISVVRTNDLFDSQKQINNYYDKSSLGFSKSSSEVSYLVTKSLRYINQFNKSYGEMEIKIHLLGGAINDAKLKQQSAFAYRDYPYLVELSSYWTDPTYEAQALALIAQVRNIFSSIKEQYVNFHRENTSWKDQMYYSANTNKLKNI